MSQTFTREDVAKHNKDGDLWVIIKDKVYDLSKFSSLHPGGKSALVNVAGKDATSEFAGLHRPYVLDKYQNLCIGTVGAAVEESKKLVEAKDAKKGRPGFFGDGIPFGDPNWYTTNVSPYYNESHKEFRKRVRDFVDKEILPFVHEVSFPSQ